MNSIKVVGENKKEFTIDIEKNSNSGLINNEKFEWDVIKVKENVFHVLKNNKSYNVEVLSINKEDKLFFIKVNGIKYKFTIKDKYDELLHTLGMDNLVNNKVAELKAPMPGLILGISVTIGDTVSKGDTLLILEAMKMENSIKSPTDGVIKNIAVKKGETVEKNQVILNFL
ncbi:MAG: acetyl-CoA carboxylase biotin carboxyl carrier protein subunit [Flavobacteriales bacterium CG_4_9_14_3_um_filter_32_8]|nr:MAG: acetyl-CoA carboxylase biotin carboxyl carrier protein subunit [Flavobacteriales bacterium CG_4_9_14_3_um_filter_32_8]